MVKPPQTLHPLDWVRFSDEDCSISVWNGRSWEQIIVSSEKNTIRMKHLQFGLALMMETYKLKILGGEQHSDESATPISNS